MGKQFNDFFIKYPNAKQQLLAFYDDHGLNPYKLQKNAQKIKNVKNLKQKIGNLIPKDYEQNLEKMKKIFDGIWMYIKLKPMRNEIIHWMLKQKEQDDDLVIDKSLIRYSLIRMIVFNIKRVVWSKHFI